MNLDLSIAYSIAFFIIVLLAASVLNLFRQHYIFQITGIAFLFASAVIRATLLIKTYSDITFTRLYGNLLPLLSGICACLISMALGFWIFPPIRKRFK